jgi:hypothetical protein
MNSQGARKKKKKNRRRGKTSYFLRKQREARRAFSENRGRPIASWVRFGQDRSASFPKKKTYNFMEKKASCIRLSLPPVRDESVSCARCKLLAMIQGVALAYL